MANEHLEDALHARIKRLEAELTKTQQRNADLREQVARLEYRRDSLRSALEVIQTTCEQFK